MQVYLSAAPEHSHRAMQHHHRIAHAAYRIAGQSRLLTQALPVNTRGGILSLSDRDAPPITEPQQLCRAVFQECCRRNYHAVLADFEQQLTRDRLLFLRRLQPILEKSRRTLFLPEAMAQQVPRSTAVICTALSGGSLAQRLEEAAARFGAEHTALDLQRLIMDFPLPCPSGTGTPLSREQLHALTEQHRPLTFYSPELAARYFTYTQSDSHHFVLYDDADTLREKLRLGKSLGISTAFLMLPEVEDLLEALFPTA